MLTPELISIAAVPSFPGLRRFPEGRGFKQWTGDDSKALMKVRYIRVRLRCKVHDLLMCETATTQVYLPAITGHVPAQMVRALGAFLEFCYLVRRDVITTTTLAQIEDSLSRFHLDRVVFEDVGVRMEGFSLPRQHSMMHYPFLIQSYGAPNGLCSSITESKHIKAVKEPYRRSNRYEALGQMLITNQRLDKLSAARADFASRGMLRGSCIRAADEEDDIWAGLGLDDEGVHDPAAVIDAEAAAREDDDGGPVDGDLLNEVTLAKRKGVYLAKLVFTVN